FENSLKHNYPNSQIIMVDSAFDGFNMLKNGSANGLVLPKLSSDYILHHYDYNKDLKIIDILNIEPARFVIGISNDKYPLTMILNKALLSIPPENLHELTGKWYINSQYLNTKNLLNNRNKKWGYYITFAFLAITLLSL